MSRPHQFLPPDDDPSQRATDRLPAPQPEIPAIQRYEAGDRARRALQSARQMPDLLAHAWLEGETADFPTERSLGRFWWRDAGAWQLLGNAQGRVRFPPQRDVRFANESSPLTTDDLDQLLVLPQLTRLDLTGRTIDDAILQQVVALPRLTTLAIHHGRLTAAAIADLALARDLRVLLLDSTVEDPDALASFPLLPHLRRFTLQRSALPDAALRTLAATTALRALTLRDCNLRTTDIAALRNLPAALSTLDLGRNPLDDAAVSTLALPQRAALRTLALDGTAITSRGAAQLRTCRSLQELDLSSTAVDGGALVHLLAALPLHHLALNWTTAEPDAFRRPALRHLSSLELRGSRWAPAAWSWLRASAPALARLDLAYAALDDAHIEHLAALTTLTHLNLRGTGITDDAVPGLLRLPRLTWLGVEGTLISREGLNTLHAERPTLTLA